VILKTQTETVMLRILISGASILKGWPSSFGAIKKIRQKN